MDLALFGWNYDLVLPLAASATAFAVIARRRQPNTPRRLAANSLSFWLAGLALCTAYTLIFLRNPGSAESQSIVLTISSIHKAVGLGFGALLASYLPFGLVAILSMGKLWRSPIVYAGVTAVLLIPLLLALPFITMMSAIISCVIFLVQACL